MNTVWNQIVSSNLVTASNWWGFLLTIGSGTLAFWVLKRVFFRRLRRWSQKTDQQFDDLAIQILDGWNVWLFSFVSGILASRLLALPPFVQDWLDLLGMIVLLLYLAFSLQQIIRFSFSMAINRRRKEQPDFDPTLLVFARTTTVIGLWIIAGLLALQNAGFEIAALLGGLGIGGIAVAFAVQNVLGDFFSSFSIYFDKPFQVGDFIVVGTQSGTVKKIGLRSTRIKTLQGEELIIANQDLTSARIQNFKKLDRRRVVFEFGVLYETPLKKVQQIPQLVETIINQAEHAEFGRAHFKSLGDFALVFEVVYHVTTEDYKIYMDTQQSINLELMSVFAKNKIEFAYPTQTILTKS